MTERTSSPNSNVETSLERKLHTHEILASMPNVMFHSIDASAPATGMDARPLHVSSLEEDGDLWFVVPLDSAVANHVKATPRASVTGHEGKKWIYLTGRASVVLDRAKLRSLWTTAHDATFPFGVEDPNVALVHFQPEHAEYWDGSGILGVKLMLEAAKAYVTGAPMADVRGTHGEVQG
jgi:general stress protein 26